MAIAPLTQISGSLPLDRTSIENNDRMASLSRSTPTPNDIRSSGGVARRFTAQRSVAAETLQPQTTSRSYSRDPRTDVSGLRTSRTDNRYKPRDPVSLSFEATSRSGATNSGNSTSRTRVAQSSTAPTAAPSTGTTATTGSAKEVLAAFDALLQQALGTKVKLPADLSHTDRVKFAARAVTSLPPAQKAAFLEQAEAIGKSLGFNFGLTKTDATGKRVALNAGVAAQLGEGAAKEYTKVASQLTKAPSATPAAADEKTGTEGTDTATQTAAQTAAKTQAAQAMVQTLAAKVDANSDGSITAEEITAAQKNTPELATAWASLSPDGKAVSTADFVTGLTALVTGTQATPAAPNPSNTPTPTATATPDATSALPDAQTFEAFKALDLNSAIATIQKMSAETVAAIVNAVAAGGTTISRAQFDAINPKLAAAYDWRGKDTVSVATLTEDLTKLTGKPTALTATPTNPAVAPTADAGTQQ